MKSNITIQPVIIPGQRHSDGTYNVKVRLTYKRKYRILATQYNAAADEVTKAAPQKLKKNSNAWLRASELCGEMYKALGDLTYAALDYMEVDDLARYLERRLHEGSVSFRLDFFEYGYGWADKRRTVGTGNTYRVALNAFKRYLGRNTIDISEISGQMIMGFWEYLDKEEKVNVSRKLAGKERQMVYHKKPGISAAIYIPRIHSIYDAAKREFNDDEAGIINIPKNPFSRLPALPKLPPARIAKSREEMQRIIGYVGRAGIQERRALDIYILSFALMGMNLADMFEAPPLKGDILAYERKKTKNQRLDRAYIEVKVDRRIMPLIERYKDPDGKRLFRFYHDYQEAKCLGDRIGKGLDSWATRVGCEHFIFYSARHSWATIARSSACGVDKALMDECLNHVSPEMRMADVYAERDWSLLWGANKKVLDLFEWPEEWPEGKWRDK